MPRTRSPRAGSMQFWPRARSSTETARIRHWPNNKEAKLLGFAGYKVGMSHVLITDNRQSSLTKGTEIFCPTTVIECPPLKAISIRFYKKFRDDSRLVSELYADSLDKELGRRINLPTKKGKEVVDFDFVRLMCATQPKLTGFGKKRPEVFEVALGGNKEQQLAYAKEKLGKEIAVGEVFKEGQQLDIHSVTRGKGFQGPRRRFGVTLRHHKSEKSRRNPGSLGAWRAQGHLMWRTAHAGKMGYNLRTEYNKWVIKIGNKAEEVNVKGGFLHYGLVKNSYILVKGSLGGAQKRFIRLTEAIKPKKGVPGAPQITYTSLESKQGR
ncbi:MAG TPA: 50S ribosomal protein L3 [Candidatus Nanoarchaeia archaeon]|nr:50S ribosomal protein L3P [uncultured archaeon]HLC62219.1 50S ribosomal protein L3 [Candidatus Nanoarchaeia archaeon]